LYSTFVSSFRLGFIYLSLKPSLFIFKTIWRHEFSYAAVLALVILVWEFLVEYFGCGWLFCACARGCVSSLRIRTTMLVQLFSIKISIGRMLCLSYASCGVMPMMIKGLKSRLCKYKKKA
jgi:hypothetical protein